MQPRRIATLALALALTTLAPAPALAARSTACDQGERLVADTPTTYQFDLNGNGFICADNYHAPKKPGPGQTYYHDDRI